MKGTVVAFAWGTLFGTGLALSGMVDPRKVLGFLDVFGAWDPSLLFVMLGATGMFALLRPRLVSRGRSLFGASMPVRTPSPIDARLVGGAAVFGLGWGLGGYCPGPAVVSLGSGGLGALAIVPAMIVGIRLADLFARPTTPAYDGASVGPGPHRTT